MVERGGNVSSDQKRQCGGEKTMGSARCQIVKTGWQAHDLLRRMLASHTLGQTPSAD